MNFHKSVKTYKSFSNMTFLIAKKILSSEEQCLDARLWNIDLYHSYFRFQAISFKAIATKWRHQRVDGFCTLTSLNSMGNSWPKLSKKGLALHYDRQHENHWALWAKLAPFWVIFITKLTSFQLARVAFSSIILLSAPAPNKLKPGMLSLSTCKNLLI